MKELTKMMQKQMDKMSATGNLFVSTVSGDQVWDAYLKGFGDDPIYRDHQSSVHNCNCCRNFVHKYGNIIAFDENLNMITLWDIENCPEEYENSVKAMNALLKGSTIQDIFTETFDSLHNCNYEKTTKTQHIYQLGTDHNVKRYTKEEALMYPNSGINPNDVVTFHHMFVKIPKEFVNNSGISIEALKGETRTRAQVFKRGLTEISIDTLRLVRDLEAQGSLLNGESYKYLVLKAIKAKEEFDSISEHKKNTYVWLKSIELGNSAAFRNTAIGTLMVDLSEGKEINEAVKAFNYKVDPVNYMKATAPITKRQIAEAEKFVEENGYAESFNRRCATIEDIRVCDVLHSNMSTAKTKVSIFDKVKSSTPSRHKKSEFDNVEEVGIEKFMQDILPTCTSVEVYLTSKHEKNFVNLLTSNDKHSKSLFKWNNNFSWTYKGNIAGKSQIKEAVKAAGGFVDAPFRFSIMWNEDGRSIVDFDAHAQEPRGQHIYYSTYKGHKTPYSGSLDIDMIRPTGVGVENIFWTDMSRVKDGVYKFWINNFDGGRNTGCKAEIAIGDSVYQYHVPMEIKKGDVFIANVYIKNGQLEEISHSPYLVNSEETVKNVYGLDTCEFHKVNLVCLSPNYWQEQGVGNKHYFFMLEGAQSPEEIRSIHNEFLNDELRNHRKVMEVLGSTLKVESTKGQLCGLGFNSTVRDEVILRLGGSHKRVVKVKF